jgi:hypothetical protein
MDGMLKVSSVTGFATNLASEPDLMMVIRPGMRSVGGNGKVVDVLELAVNIELVDVDGRVLLVVGGEGIELELRGAPDM